MGTHPLNVILLGNNNVGKTSLFLRMKDDTFDADASKPIPNCCDKEITVEGETTKMRLYYPEPGMNKNYHHRSLTHSYYTGAVVALIVYSADNANSIERLGDIVAEIKNNANGQARLFLIRNKVDLDITVTKEEALNKLNNGGYIDPDEVTTLDTSAKSGDGLELLKEEIGKALLEVRDPWRKDTIRVYQRPSFDDPSTKTACRC